MSEQEICDKSFVVSWDQLHRDARALAWRLDSGDSSEIEWRALVAIARGGMAPAMIIARELDIRTVDTISVKSYDHQQQVDVKILKFPDKEIVGLGERILIVDDLVDTGKTLEVVRKLYPRAHYATIYAKPKGRPLVDTFITEVSQDTWIYFPWDTGLKYVQPVRIAS